MRLAIFASLFFLISIGCSAEGSSEPTAISGTENAPESAINKTGPDTPAPEAALTLSEVLEQRRREREADQSLVPVALTKESCIGLLRQYYTDEQWDDLFTLTGSGFQFLHLGELVCETEVSLQNVPSQTRHLISEISTLQWIFSVSRRSANEFHEQSCYGDGYIVTCR